MTKHKCAKCGKTNVVLHHHHVRHEALIIAVLAETPRASTVWYKKLVERYNEFRPKDIKRLCKTCHFAVHERYKKLLRAFNKRRNYVPLAQCSFEELEGLMNKFRLEYRKWCK